jgi:hypothetical protein
LEVPRGRNGSQDDHRFGRARGRYRQSSVKFTCGYAP